MTELPDEWASDVAAALAPRYLIEREIGRGGMATVHLARDMHNRAQVAVKVMHPRLTETISSVRFLREVEVVSGLRHDRITPLLASGSVGPVLYYVMPYVEGESLAARLDRDRRLSVHEACAVVRDTAEALEYAHARGVLHRDVKPENVMLSGGRAVVLDFGLARAIGTANYLRLTQTGIVVGTAFYMSPEQLREDRDLDQRTDLYALGCLLYEMLTGEPPYTGRSVNDVIGHIIKSPIPRAGRLRREVPAGLDDMITRAMAKRAADRYTTAREFIAALDATSARSGDPPLRSG